MNPHRLAAVAAALFVAAPLAPMQASAGPYPACNWSLVKSPSPHEAFGDQNMLNAVAARSRYDAWAVGQVRVYATNHLDTVAEHWNGASWQIVPTPNTADLTNVLYGVAMIRPDDVWAVGYSQPQGFAAPYYALIEHWDGKTWSIVQSDSRLGVLTSVTATGPGDIWAVGSSNYPGLGVIEHWDGHRWFYHQLHDAVLLNSVTAISSDDVWAVGEQYRYRNGGEITYTLRFDGTAWTRIPSPNPLTRHKTYAQNWLRSVSGLASFDVWAFGETRDTDFPGGLDDTLTLHWDGRQWNVVDSPDPGGSVNYNSFWAGVEVPGQGAYAVGDFGLDVLAPMAEHWNGTSWDIQQTPASIADGALEGTAADREGDVWAVGDKELRPYVLGTLTELCRLQP